MIQTSNAAQQQLVAAAREVWLSIGISQLDHHAARFEERHGLDYSGGGKVPANHDWRPFRFAVQDVLLFAAVIRHQREENCLEVDVLVTIVHEDFEDESGPRAATIFLLSEAFRCGTSMELRFTEHVEGGRVPEALQLLAVRYGVTLDHIEEGRITSEEAGQLFLAVTEFSPALRQDVHELGELGFLTTNRACYMVHHGIWTVSEIEQILRSTNLNDAVLDGELMPEQRHLYRHVLDQARGAVLGGILDRALRTRDYDEEDGERGKDVEDDDRDLSIGFEPGWYAKAYSCSEDLPLPGWDAHLDLLGERFDDCAELPRLRDWQVPPGRRLVALVRARGAAELEVEVWNDLALAGARRERGRPEELVCLVVSGDLTELPVDTQRSVVLAARDHQVGLLVCPDSSSALDEQAVRRLDSSRSMRD